MYYLSVNKFNSNVDMQRVGETIPSHIAWIKARISEGSIVQAGKWGSLGGMSIIKAQSLKEAKEVIEDDPLLQASLVTYELDEFYPNVEL